MNTSTRVVFVSLVLVAVAATAFGADSAATEAPSVEVAVNVPWAKAVAIVGACFGAALCAIGGGYGIARIGSACIESIARQPEAAGAMFAPLVISAAMVEGGMLFAIVVCLLGVLFI